MSFGIKPLANRVVIKKLEAEEKTQGGIILANAAKEKPQTAEVVAVGPGTKDEVMEVKVGDTVDCHKWERVLLASSRWRPGMLPNGRQCTGQLPSEELSDL